MSNTIFESKIQANLEGAIEQKNNIISTMNSMGYTIDQNATLDVISDTLANTTPPYMVQFAVYINKANGDVYEIPSDMTGVTSLLHIVIGGQEYKYTLDGLEDVYKQIQLTGDKNATYKVWIDFIGDNAIGYQSNTALGLITPATGQTIRYEINLYTKLIEKDFVEYGVFKQLATGDTALKRIVKTYDASKKLTSEKFGYFVKDTQSTTSAVWMDETALTAGVRCLIKNIYTRDKFTILCNGTAITEFSSFTSGRFYQSDVLSIAYTFVCDLPSDYVDTNSLSGTLDRDGTNETLSFFSSSKNVNNNTLTFTVVVEDSYKEEWTNGTTNSFDNIYPWSKIHTVDVKTEGTNGSTQIHKMTKIPKFYVKRVPNVTRTFITKYNDGTPATSIEIVGDEMYISKDKIDDLYELPPDFLDYNEETGEYTELDAFYRSSTWASTNTMNINGTNQTTLKSSLTGDTYTQNNNGGYLEYGGFYSQITNANRYNYDSTSNTYTQNNSGTYLKIGDIYTAIENSRRYNLKEGKRNNDNRISASTYACRLNETVTTILEDPVDGTSEIELAQSPSGWNIGTIQSHGGILIPLFMIEMATTNCQNIIPGQIYGSDSNRRNNECAPIFEKGYSTCIMGGSTDNTAQFVYRYMQDLYGSLNQHTTGIQTFWKTEEYTALPSDVKSFKYDNLECEVISVSVDESYTSSTDYKYLVTAQLPSTYTYVSGKSRYLEMYLGSEGFTDGNPGFVSYDDTSKTVTYSRVYSKYKKFCDVLVQEHNKRSKFTNTASNGDALSGYNYVSTGTMMQGGYVYDYGCNPEKDPITNVEYFPYWWLPTGKAYCMKRKNQNTTRSDSTNYADYIYAMSYSNTPDVKASFFCVGGSCYVGFNDGLFLVRADFDLSFSVGGFGSFLTLSLQAS